ncbi:MAG: hypothetical protein ACRDI0_11685 [Actinomycetota bacterium]
MRTRDELWEWVWKDGWERPPAGREDEAARGLAEALLRAPEEDEAPVSRAEEDEAPASRATALLTAPEEGAAVVAEPPPPVAVRAHPR